VHVAGRYVMDPSPIPKFDNPKMDNCPALQLFGAGREKRIYAIPPHTRVVSLDFEDYPFEVTKFDHPCALCGATASYLDEVVTDDRGGRMFVCSDTDYCETRRKQGHHGALYGGEAPEAKSSEVVSGSREDFARASTSAKSSEVVSGSREDFAVKPKNPEAAE
jgi:alpha-D-ribose 1-methylphosphonate 5-phosphate C-P lyase